MIQTKFTPLHLTILIDAYVGKRNGYADTPTARDYEFDLVKQGLIYYSTEDRLTVNTTKYGERKLKELLIKMELPYETH